MDPNALQEVNSIQVSRTLAPNYHVIHANTTFDANQDIAVWQMFREVKKNKSSPWYRTCVIIRILLRFVLLSIEDTMLGTENRLRFSSCENLSSNLRNRKSLRYPVLISGTTGVILSIIKVQCTRKSFQLFRISAP